MGACEENCLRQFNQQIRRDILHLSELDDRTETGNCQEKSSNMMVKTVGRVCPQAAAFQHHHLQSPVLAQPGGIRRRATPWVAPRPIK